MKNKKVKIIGNNRYSGQIGDLIRIIKADGEKDLYVVKMKDLCEVMFIKEEIEIIK